MCDSVCLDSDSNTGISGIYHILGVCGSQTGVHGWVLDLCSNTGMYGWVLHFLSIYSNTGMYGWVLHFLSSYSDTGMFGIYHIQGVCGS